MLRILRITVMWLVALALPVQGLAAASMVGCGAGHHAGSMRSHAQGIRQHETGPRHSLGVEHVLAMATAHHHHDQVDGPAAGDMQQPDTDAAMHAKVSKASCSACAACCTSAALPTTPLVFQATDAPSVFMAVAPQPVVSFVSGGLERPPRPFLA